MKQTQNFDASLLIPTLKQIPLFAELTDDSIQKIISKIILMYYPPDFSLFREGDLGDAMYIIKNGKVSIFHSSKDDMPLIEIAQLSDNAFFGEMALVSDVPRNASAKTLKESEIFILKKEAFNLIVTENRSLAEQISEAVIERTKRNNKTA